MQLLEAELAYLHLLSNDQQDILKRTYGLGQPKQSYKEISLELGIQQYILREFAMKARDRLRLAVSVRDKFSNQ